MYVYIVFLLDCRDGPVVMFAAKDRASLVDEFKAQATAFCSSELIAPTVESLLKTLEMDDDFLAMQGNIPLNMDGTYLRLCVLE